MIVFDVGLQVTVYNGLEAILGLSQSKPVTIGTTIGKQSPSRLGVGVHSDSYKGDCNGQYN